MRPSNVTLFGKSIKKDKMKMYKILILSVAFLFMHTGCQDKFIDLDKEPLNLISGAAVFKDKILTEAYVAQLYHAIPWHYGSLNSPSNWIMVEGMWIQIKNDARWHVVTLR